MKTNAIILFWVGLFVLLVDGIYWLWNYIDHGGIEWVGSMAMLLIVGLCWFPAFYLYKAGKAAENLPEDIPTANIEDGDSEIGQFSPWSWWPIFLAASCAVLFMGLALGWWIFFIGLALTLVSVIGWSFEHHRGNFGH